MRKREEYQAKVTDDTGLTRGRVPGPLLREMNARPGDRLIFRLGNAGQAVMRVARSKSAGKRAKAGRKQARKQGG